MAEKYRNRYQGGGWDGSYYNRDRARFATRHPIAAWVTWHAEELYLAAKQKFENSETRQRIRNFLRRND